MVRAHRTPLASRAHGGAMEPWAGLAIDPIWLGSNQLRSLRSRSNGAFSRSKQSDRGLRSDRNLRSDSILDSDRIGLDRKFVAYKSTLLYHFMVTLYATTDSKILHQRLPTQLLIEMSSSHT